MRYKDPLKQILAQNRTYWDNDGTRAAVRHAFSRALQCRTAELGAEVYAFENEELVVYHTCKSRACPSCGYRATVQWLRERWAALPDVVYKGITFSMPDVLWHLFRDNPHLAKILSALAAKIIEARASSEHGLRVGVISILHTFNGELAFNSHVHTMVTGGGLHGSTDTWGSSVYFDRDVLMHSWRGAIIALLRTALRLGQLNAKITVGEMEAILTKQEKRWWSIKIQTFKSKAHYLQYAGRYVKRPPIAQWRITHIGKMVRFVAKDKRQKRLVEVECSAEQFIDRWAQHIPERYRHAVRTFGLFAPRVLRQTSAAIFVLLGQRQRPRPKPRPWADSIKRDFRRDPLLHKSGNRMKWARRVSPVSPATSQ